MVPCQDPRQSSAAQESEEWSEISTWQVRRRLGCIHSKQYPEAVAAFPKRKAMNRYLIVIEVTETGYSAYSPDLPGCVSTGATREEVVANMKEAIEFHLEGMKQERYPIPEPTADSFYVEITS